MTPLSAYAVSVVGAPWGATIVHARTAGKAKYDYWLDVTDAWPDVPFTALRARKIGPPQTSAEFHRMAERRGLPELRCGQRIAFGASLGVIVGHNSSSNLDVLFDDDDPTWPGLVVNIHPHECQVLPESDTAQ